MLASGSPEALLRRALLLAIAGLAAALLASACAGAPEGTYRAPAAAPARLAVQPLVSALRVSWEPVDHADGYVVTVGTAARLELDARVSAVTVTALQPHLEYSVSVASRERSSLSAPSAAAHGAPLSGHEVTLAPTYSEEALMNGGQLGRAMAPAGDVDLDGFDDFWVLERGFVVPGEARLYYGSAVQTVDPSRTSSIVPPCATCEAGLAIATGDLDGDQRRDLAFLETRFTASRTRLTVYHSLASGLGTSLSWNRVGPPSSNVRALDALAIGDVDGDGFGDVVAGSGTVSTAGVPVSAGRIDVFLGPGPSDGSDHPPAAILVGPPLAGRFGSAVAVGDVDAGGFADAFVGAPTTLIDGQSAGRAYLHRGSASGLETTPAATFDGSVVNGRLGDVIGLFDFDGDGSAELVIGEPTLFDQRGRVCVHRFAGGVVDPLVCVEGEEVGERFGSTVGGSDVDGDGLVDLLVASDGIRSVSVFSGTVAGLDPVPAFRVEGREADATLSFGWTLASAGDLDGDGNEDVLIGEQEFLEPPFFDEGRFWVYRSRSVPDVGPRADAGLVGVISAGAPFHPHLASAADPAGVAMSCAWSWGDGSADTEIPDCSTAALESASHVYSNVGVFTLRLRVRTEDGRESEALTSVHVTGDTP